jgi:primosomal replication protein N
MNCERREYPRVPIGGEANILLAGVVRNGNMMKLSPSGIQIECRSQLVEQLAKSKSESGLYPEFELEFALPDSGKDKQAIKSTCNVSFCR